MTQSRTPTPQETIIVTQFAIKIGMRVRHVRRGSTYVVLARSRAQIDQDTVAPMTGHGDGLRTVAGIIAERLEKIAWITYRSETNGAFWHRPETEFCDGRFVAL